MTYRLKYCFLLFPIVTEDGQKVGRNVYLLN